MRKKSIFSCTHIHGEGGAREQESESDKHFFYSSKLTKTVPTTRGEKITRKRRSGLVWLGFGRWGCFCFCFLFSLFH